jgi:hypothetical protein
MITTIKTKDLIKKLNKNEYFFSEKLNNKKLNCITKEYILKNPLRIDFIDNEYFIIDGRHRLFMALAIYKLKNISITTD